MIRAKSKAEVLTNGLLYGKSAIRLKTRKQKKKYYVWYLPSFKILNYG